MKITKFREILTGEQIEQHQEVVKGINEANSSITHAVNEANTDITSAVEEVDLGIKEVAAKVQSASEDIQNSTQKIEELNQSVRGVTARSDKTKIYNQKIEEDIIILESSDANFEIPDDTCDDIFYPTQKLPEISQFFILEESTPETRCQQRKLNFDTDQEYALRLDQYSGDNLGYFHAYGHSENNSSDLSIINDTLFKIKLRTDEKKDFVTIDDGFTLSLSDIEKEDEVSLKRDHTISGYTITYMVEGKANA